MVRGSIRALAAIILSRYDLVPEAGQQIVQVYEGRGGPLYGIKMNVLKAVTWAIINGLAARRGAGTRAVPRRRSGNAKRVS